MLGLFSVDRRIVRPLTPRYAPGSIVLQSYVAIKIARNTLRFALQNTQSTAACQLLTF